MEGAMGKLMYLVLHCTATPEGQEVTENHIRQWHLGPVDLPGGQCRYLGKTYQSRSGLPNDEIGGVNIKKLKGRGWKQVGYSKLFTLDGSVIDLVKNNHDNEVDSWEITNGASGINNFSKHFVYAGGIAKNSHEAKDTRTEEQLSAMVNAVMDEICFVTDLLVCGHNQHANKACPSFFVPHWLRSIGIEEKNIYTKDPFGYSKIYPA
ncbi:lysozyme [Oscillatoria amoena NRMC-F 0135]|nr:lysozyme [Oscillatoria amoena NRMC-F 0135]